MDEAIVELLIRQVAATEAEEVSLPHIVVTRDLVTNVVTYNGPYANAIDALRAADNEHLRQQTQTHPDWRVSVDVAPLFEPDVDRGDMGGRRGGTRPSTTGPDGGRPETF